jgi:hypothetical protein
LCTGEYFCMITNILWHCNAPYPLWSGKREVVIAVLLYIFNLFMVKFVIYFFLFCVPSSEGFK